jgi:predicted RNA-binding Zn-ribbon protein involved in translation (DUF1610 family)
MSDYLDFDSPDDELRDDEYPDGPIEDDDTDTFACPHCGTEVYEDSVQCPVCGEYITSSGNPLAGWPAWWLLLGLVGVIATVLALAGLCGR